MRPSGAGAAGSGSSFLDEWLAKRKQISNSSAPAVTAPVGSGISPMTAVTPPAPQFRPQVPPAPLSGGGMMPPAQASPLSSPASFQPLKQSPTANPSVNQALPLTNGSNEVSMPTSDAPVDEHLSLRGDNKADEVSIKLR